MMWEGEWHLIWPCVQYQPKRSSARVEENVAQTVKRVTSLMRSNEFSKAAAAAWGPGESADAEAIRREFANSQEGGPTNRNPPPAPGLWDVPAELYQKIVTQISKDHRHGPKMSAGGNGQSKFEHWVPCGQLPHDDDPVARVLLRIFLGHMPAECLDLSLSACLAGIMKKSGGVRILGKGTAQRRKVGRAVARVLRNEIREACGPQQFAMQPDGAGHVHRLLSALVAARPGLAVGGCDMKQVFPSTLRDKVLEKVRKYSPETYSLVYHLYKGDSKHTVEGCPGDPLTAILQRRGLDQGCNMSMGSFCITTSTEALAH